jgi:hypothetical protein
MARSPGRATGKVASIPAPTGGWNARDSLAAMPPTDAVILENWFPDLTSLKVRKGFDSYATGVGSLAVDSVMAYTGPLTTKLFAASSDTIWDISSSGAASSAVTSLTNGRWQRTMFATSGGNFLVICNGADSVRNYDGSSWTTPSITGVTSANLIYVWPFKDRLWFIQKNTTDAWYLGSKSISGAATKFPLGHLFRLGGEVIAGGTWTRDGGNGMDDLLVLVTSEGEVAVWQGTDPSSTFSLVGVYRIGAPIGRRCIIRFGADLVIITEQGFLPLSQVMSLDPSQGTAQALSDKIRNEVNTAVASWRANFGWQGISYPAGNWGVFNIPTAEGVSAVQYVVNTLTGAWCKFTGMNACCWEVYNDALYFGGTGGAVFKADSGLDDNGSTVDADAMPAFSDFGVRARQKRFTTWRSLMKSDGNVNLSVQWNVDFSINAPASFPTAGTLSGPLWDVALWDVSYWADTPQPKQTTAAVMGVGVFAAPRVRVSTDVQTLEWYSSDTVFEVGGFL